MTKNRKAVFVAAKLPQQVAPHAEVAPIVRGACSLKNDGGEGAHRRMIAEFRTSDAILNFVNGAELQRYGASVVITPDYAIRTKRQPLILPAPEAGKLDQFKAAAAQAVAAYVEGYRKYFESHNARVGGGKRMLDPLPRVVLVPGLRALRARPLGEGRADRRRSCAGRGRDHHRCRGDRPLPDHHRGRRFRRRILADGAGQARQDERAAARRSGRRHHRRRRRDRRCDGAGVRRMPAPRSRCSTSILRRPRKAAPRRSAARRSPIACDVTDATSVRDAFAADRRNLRRRRHRRLQRRRGLAGPHRRGRRSDLCARASS